MKKALVLSLTLACGNPPKPTQEVTPFRGAVRAHIWVNAAKSQGVCPEWFGIPVEFDAKGQIAKDPVPELLKCRASNPPLVVDCNSPFGHLWVEAIEPIFEKDGHPAAHGYAYLDGSFSGCGPARGWFLLYTPKR